MVKLDKIYTKGGDGGQTSLADGSRVDKHSLRITAQGDVDEANAVFGVARLHISSPGFDDIMARVQNDMFDLGADIATPGDDPEDGSLRIHATQVARLEREIDAVSDGLEPLTSFVLRGGSAEAAHLHLACTVARRAERSMCALASAEPTNKQALIYLNRLSDLLFVMARQANAGGKSDVLWQPGLTAE